MARLTYKKAGVDIEKASRFKQKLKNLLEKSYGPLVWKGVGGFGSLFVFPKEEYKEPILVSSSDGVGTKLKISQLVNKHDTVGIDLVAMNTNDILCLGAKTLFFVDYIACGKLEPDVMFDLVKGINNGCKQSDCSLIGGETAEMPGMYKEGEYDLAGFCVGALDKSNIIDGSKIEVGDLVVGLESNGIHSNGYSLVRRVFSQKELKRMSNELLKPTRIYVKPVLSLLKKTGYTKGNIIKGIAHITGGAFYDKIARILPKGVGVSIDKESWIVPEIFKLIQKRGNIEDREMYHTFNMGIGMVLIIEPKSMKAVLSHLSAFKLKSYVIGEVVKYNKQVEMV
ncbi:MAG: phosphoribosylformylglycinamidine cyclo-ligase [Candidatus Omnitrophica bacterium]|nr:phosphoribosylformylglycinamidine cyclo-ligase [Candidatus Omnitrophota bacterium]